MAYADEPGMSTKRLVSLVLVGLIHVLLGYAVISGLALKAVKIVAGPLETFEVEEPPEVEEEPPPPPEQLDEIPPYVPPPDVVVENLPPPPAPVTTVRTPPPPAPPMHGVHFGATDGWTAQDQREMEEADAQMVQQQAELREALRAVRQERELTRAERARVERELERATAELERSRGQVRRAAQEAARAAAAAPQVHETVSADGGVRTIRLSQAGPDGRSRVVQEHVVDERAIERSAMQAAIAGIEGARVAIASNDAMSAEIRAEVLAELDAELADLRREFAE